MANYGMKVSKSSYDVKSTGDANLIFSSKLATHPIERAVKFSGVTSKTITHGLNYIPKVWAFEKWDSDYVNPGRTYRLPRAVFNSPVDFYMTSSSIVLENLDSDLTYYVIVFARDIT